MTPTPPPSPNATRKLRSIRRLASWRLAVFFLISFALGCASPATASALRYYKAQRSDAPYSAVVRAGNLLYVSGQLGIGPNGEAIVGFDAQARAAMDGVASALIAAGSSMDQVAKCTVMLTHISDWAAFNKIYLAYFSPGHLPARTAFAVNELARGTDIEVDCIAAINARPSIKPLRLRR